ncbi:MAG: long-chain-fatty-acid--CoA ligase [Egibacteraceae bacterium]
MLNLALLLEDSAREVPDRPAVVLGEQPLSYAAVNAAANQVANELVARGIKPGDRVALSCPNLPHFPVTYYGILKAGATVVPLNVLLKPREIAYHLRDSRARAYFCFAGTPELPIGAMGEEAFGQVSSCEHLILLEPGAVGIECQPATFESVATSSEDTAVVLYTSGTTGQPKGAELTHLNMLLNARLADVMYPRVDHDVHLVTLPLFHSFGQSVQMNGGFYTKATLVLLPRFTPGDALRLMQRHDVTVFVGVPTMYWAMLTHDAEGIDIERIARTLRLAISGGAALPLEVLKGFEQKFSVQILEGYGLSETSPVATFNRYDRQRKPGTVGPPVWGVSVRVVDSDGHDVPAGELGEIVIRGHNVMKGYLGRPDATAAAIRNGWFHTGDIGSMDAEGYVSITDRVKDMIIRGGFNVYPRELEEVLLTHPGVSLCAVVGVPHERLGQEVKAFVVRTAEAALTEQELVAWCKEQMAGYKYPRLVEFRDELPMTATGKILKRELA